MPFQSTSPSNADLTLQEDIEKLRRIGFIK